MKMRDVLAALLRASGYEHNDEVDPDDMYWQSPKLGVRPMLVCVAYEINREIDHPTPGWNTYDVSVAQR